MAALVLTPLNELEILQRRLAEVERWSDTSVRDIALRFLHEQVTSLGREIRSTGFPSARRQGMAGTKSRNDAYSPLDQR